ncbi:DNA ligase, partial [Candidatus Bathyarchaeota archaeon]|nr:DNA ligase [Candidatus Bathyarchaeota archaeon]
ARGFLWIKYKRDYKSELIDTIDLVVVGAFAGRGRRAGTYGALLMAAYDTESDGFKTVSKLGTGFNDANLAKLPKTLKPYKIDHIHPRVDSQIEADYWFAPTVVLEVIGAELTLSPSHTCGLNIVREGAGLAIRFPRFTGKWRNDKSAEDATTVKEIVDMYKGQLKKF